jgi:acyl carrier protein
VSATDVAASLREVMADRLGIAPEQITPEARLVEDLGLDSLDAVELAIAVERRFEIEVAEEELARLQTVADMLALVESRTAARGG